MSAGEYYHPDSSSSVDTTGGRTWLAREAKSESLEGVLKWMGQRAMVGGSEATNAVRAAEHAIRQRGASKATAGSEESRKKAIG